MFPILPSAERRLCEEIAPKGGPGQGDRGNPLGLTLNPFRAGDTAPLGDMKTPLTIGWYLIEQRDERGVTAL